MSDVINGVPRELLERAERNLCSGEEAYRTQQDLRALLTAQPQASAAQSAPDEREAFERWATSQGEEVKTDGADYYASTTSHMYSGWLARARLQQDQQAAQHGICEFEADSDCREADGCPTENAVLKRFWREHNGRPVHEDIIEAVKWVEHLLFECGALTQTRAPSRYVYNKTFEAVEAAKLVISSRRAPKIEEVNKQLLEALEAGMFMFEHAKDSTPAAAHRYEAAKIAIGRAHKALNGSSCQNFKPDPVRDREADRATFTDPLFNKWLDEPIDEAGEFTVWNMVGDIGAAWHGWDNRQFYVDQAGASWQRAQSAPAGEREALSAYCRAFREKHGQAPLWPEQDDRFHYFQAGAAWQRTQSAPVVPEGCRLVPENPTKAMREAGNNALAKIAAAPTRGLADRAFYAFCAMLAAAPQPAAQGEAVYQIQYLGDGGGGWCDVEKSEHDSYSAQQDYRTRTLYAHATAARQEQGE